MTTILIDNYDSFTWNLYEYLNKLGASVKVFRNDQFTLKELENYEIKNIIISPGPGSPSTDSGLSMDVINKYKGRVPILGVCLGLQCIAELFGGKVVEIGHIVHGKTSKIKHDGHGIFENVGDNCLMTRYHSLAPDILSLPECLMISAKSEDGIIQGLRHKKYCLTGVQFHPESILSDHGIKILENFLKFNNGLWNDIMIRKIKCNTVLKDESILDRIVKKRLEDVEIAKNILGRSFKDLEALYELSICDPPLNLYERLKIDSINGMCVMSEIKRASPSKGIINSGINVIKQAILYSKGGASVISVLTEPCWFKGSLDDMLFISKAIKRLINRPLVLRKDFIMDKYQVLESRLYGADTVLLIVSTLNKSELLSLLNYSRSLGLEPLVEVYNSEEMEKAISVGAKVIGINNRNLNNFNVDLSNTLNITPKNSKDIIFVALSGISDIKDVDQYRDTSVKAVLIGEALMKSNDPINFINSIINNNPHIEKLKLDEDSYKPLVKICGIKCLEDAKMCIDKGADLLGFIFVPKSKRCIDVEIAKHIITEIRKDKSQSDSCLDNIELDSKNNDWFSFNSNLIKLYKKPLIVAVFQDQPMNYILNICNIIKPDLIQLCGKESVEIYKKLNIPFIKVFHLKDNISSYNQNIIFTPNHHCLPLLDTFASDGKMGGGTGVKFDWNLAIYLKSKYKDLYNLDFPIILAGGLNPDNVKEAVNSVKPFMIDVASGVEEDGYKSEKLVENFIKNAKN